MSKSTRSRQIHVTQRPDGSWQAKKAGGGKASAVEATKADVMKRARTIARNQGLELIPHKRDGKISNPDSYGNDPMPPKDTRS